MPPRRRRGRRHRRRGDGDDDDDDDDDNGGDDDRQEPQLKAIDLNLPQIVLHDFRQWNEQLDRLQDENGTRNADVFAINGVYTEGGQHYRAGLDFDRHMVTRDIVLTTSCDIDSVIALVLGDLPIHPRANFGYYMLADPTYTLTDGLSIPHIELRQGNNVESVPVHHIPNARFGKMGRFLILIFFPALYDAEHRKQSESPNAVGDDYMELFYNHAVRQATDHMIPQDQRRNWAATYEDELFRAGPPRDRDERRRRVARLARLHTERIVPGDLFVAWFQEIRRLCGTVDELEFAQGIFLVVDGKGFKENNMSSHLPPLRALVDDAGDFIDPDNERTAAIEAIFENYFVPANFAPGEWYIDIATNVSGQLAETGQPVSLFINSDLHPEILHHFTGQPLAECSRWVRRRSNGYVRDLVAHISKFAGLHQTFLDPVDYDATRFQGYTTDKGVTYRPDFAKKAIRTSPSMCLQNWDRESEEHFRRLAEVYMNASEAHTVAVRFETRIPFESYPYVHLNIGARTLQPWLFWVRNTAFWGFKWRRLNAIWNILEAICAAEKARSKFSLRKLPEVGSLVILLVYMANALVNRPDDGGNFDEVHDAGCIHEIINAELVPVIHLGYYIIHTTIFPCPEEINRKLPRISSLRTISPEKLIYLFATTKDERNELHVLRLIRNDRKRQAEDADEEDPWRVAPQRTHITYPHVSNKQRVTLALPGPVPNVLENRLPDEELYEPYPSEEEDPEVRERPHNLSRQVVTVIYTYPLQIIAKMPNRRGGRGSWSRFNTTQRSNANFELFCDTTAPSRMFYSWNNFGRDISRWDSTLTALFPSLKQLSDMGKIQGLSLLSIRHDWRTILIGLSPEGERRTVQEAKDYVSSHWKWLPYYTKKKLWVTGEPPETRESRQSKFGYALSRL
ncbi:Astrotactin-1 [Rhizoctonia solani]|uniref:Astrotactin-1 n=1 Tax=Rhizoctonia solani TaxID=456999 RepID=A0A0K6G7T8_9AGAM|nr:Astrotactin-1 [Rhizoctonia solani]